MSFKNLDLSIQIVNYNTKKYLIKCVTDVIKDLKGSALTYGINVLDNNSEDDLSDLEKKFKGKVNFYYSDKNLGFGAGHNYLAKKSSSTYLLILNPDIEFLEKNSILRLYELITSNNSIKVVGPQLKNNFGQTQPWDHAQLNYWLPTGGFWKTQKEITEVAWVSGAVFLIERGSFEQAGNFDENYFLYGEETDLCYCVRKNGGKILYDPSIKILHHGSVVAKKEKYLKRSFYYLFSKYYKNRFYYPLIKLYIFLFV